MNDLITILIILAALISFLNKIFGQKKGTGSAGRRQSEGEAPLPSWFPPWLETTAKQEPARPVQRRKPEPTKPPSPEKEMPDSVKERTTAPLPAKPAPEIRAVQLDNQLLRSVKAVLKSQDELKRGIILAEILAPCLAKRTGYRIF